MNHLRHLLLRRLTVILALTMLLCNTALAEDLTLLSIGPRFGFSGKTPFFGKEQKHHFYLADVAAVVRLPWSWRLGHDAWKLETRLITSAGYLWAAGDGGLLATVVPNLTLSAWSGLVTLDIGGGAAFLSNYQFGMQDLGGPVQAVATAGIRLNPSLMPMPDFASSTYPMPAFMAIPVWVWTCISWNSATASDRSFN